MNNFMHGKNFLSLMEEAKNGNTDAQIELGDRYFDGDGISKNIDLSIKWYKKAAEQGSADAQFELAVIYEDDEIVEHNYDISFYWYEKAAIANNTAAQYSLGSIYDEGKYISRDINKAVYWYELAANKGDIDASMRLGELFENDEDITRDLKKAYYYYKIASEKDILAKCKILDIGKKIKVINKKEIFEIKVSILKQWQSEGKLKDIQIGIYLGLSLVFVAIIFFLCLLYWLIHE